MYAGQLVFAQLMDHLPWKTFGRIVERYGGDRRIRELVWQGCVETPCRARHEPPGNAQTPPGGGRALDLVLWSRQYRDAPLPRPTPAV